MAINNNLNWPYKNKLIAQFIKYLNSTEQSFILINLLNVRKFFFKLNMF